ILPERTQLLELGVGELLVGMEDDDRRELVVADEVEVAVVDLGGFGAGGQELRGVVLGHLGNLPEVGPADAGSHQPDEGDGDCYDSTKGSGISHAVESMGSIPQRAMPGTPSFDVVPGIGPSIHTRSSLTS